MLLLKFYILPKILLLLVQWQSDVLTNWSNRMYSQLMFISTGSFFICSPIGSESITTTAAGAVLLGLEVAFNQFMWLTKEFPLPAFTTNMALLSFTCIASETESFTINLARLWKSRNSHTPPFSPLWSSPSWRPSLSTAAQSCWCWRICTRRLTPFLL